LIIIVQGLWDKGYISEAISEAAADVAWRPW